MRGRHVLLLDDILDTGQTLSHLVRHLQEQGAASVKVAVLLRKEGRQVHAVRADFVGFDIPNEFVVGYGLDFNDEYRQLALHRGAAAGNVFVAPFRSPSASEVGVILAGARARKGMMSESKEGLP